MAKKQGKILIIDDDKDVLYTAKMILKPHYETVTTEDTPNRIESLLSKDFFDVILLDMNFKPGATEGNEGLYWLKQIRKINPESNVILNTAYGDINLAVQAMKEGAIDFLIKPWEKEKLISTVNTVYKLSRSNKEANKFKSKQEILARDINKNYENLITQSKAMKPVLDIIDKVSGTDANVLILGENGTGKELIARTIHQKSKRLKETFMSVDLGSLTTSLFESELFGYKKGAFTDAKEDKPGRFEAASGGTLFLDEIGNIAEPLQAKLLTVLQNRLITPLGSAQNIPIDIRLITATNKNLNEMVASQDFREDLLYRINTVEIILPPLRERHEDIPLLVEYYLEIHAKKYEKPYLSISKQTMEKLISYHWPGNVRELAHSVERAVIMANGTILQPEDFLFSKTSKQNIVLKDNYTMEEMENTAIINALEKHKGNLTQAAKTLGLGRSTLYRKMEKYGI
jgi:two-component system, NtrC family, response regulator HydG